MSGRSPFKGTGFVSLGAAKSLLRTRNRIPSKAALMYHVKHGHLKPDAVVHLPNHDGPQAFYGFVPETLRKFAALVGWLFVEPTDWT